MAVSKLIIAVLKLEITVCSSLFVAVNAVNFI